MSKLISLGGENSEIVSTKTLVKLCRAKDNSAFSISICSMTKDRIIAQLTFEISQNQYIEMQKGKIETNKGVVFEVDLAK